MKLNTISRSTFLFAGLSLAVALNACAPNGSDSREPIRVRTSNTGVPGVVSKAVITPAEECELDLSKAVKNIMEQKDSQLRVYTADQHLFIRSDENSNSFDKESSSQKQILDDANLNLEHAKSLPLVSGYGMTSDLRSLLAKAFSSEQPVESIDQSKDCKTLSIRFAAKEGEDSKRTDDFEILDVSTTKMSLRSDNKILNLSFKNGNRLSIEEYQTIQLGDFCSEEEASDYNSFRTLHLDWAFGTTSLEVKPQILMNLADFIEISGDDGSSVDSLTGKNSAFINESKYQYFVEKFEGLNKEACKN